jgi:NAD dependent epimerase/dehydratase family enzyme
VARRIIWLAPPQAQGNNQELLQAGLYARRQQQRYGGIVPCISYVSTTGVYGNTQGAEVDEYSPIRPQTARAKRRAKAEQHLKTLSRCVFAHSKARFYSQVLRAPGIYSAQRLPLERLRQGLPAICAEEDSWSNHIHEVDLARLCMWAQFKARAWITINACDQHPCQMGDYFDCVADWAKLPRPPRLPKALVHHKVSPMMWSFMEESRRVISKHQSRLRFVLRYPTVQNALACNSVA